ncbi:MAG: hypothetical protein RL328_2776 [Acidobacteriota bacterium]
MRGSPRFLQAVIALFGIAALAFLLWEPHVEGRNAHATTFEIYFKDPFLAYAYFASGFFFASLYKAIQLLEYIRRDELFSESSVKALGTIKKCATAVVGFVVAGVGWIVFFSGSDDHPPAVVMGGFISLVSFTVATAAAVGERMLRNAVAMKSENDLTV